MWAVSNRRSGTFEPKLPAHLGSPGFNGARGRPVFLTNEARCPDKPHQCKRRGY